MLLILAPFIVFFMVTALYDTMNRQRRINQLHIENNQFNVIPKDRYEPIESPTALSGRYRTNTVQATCQNWRPDEKSNKTCHISLDINETEATNDSEQKKLVNQIAADVSDPAIRFSETELELVRAGYIQRMTGKRKLSKKNKNSYITARKGKVFDVRKIIKVMQKKVANESFNENHNDSMMIKLESLQMGINALMAQDELPKDFAIPDDCIVHRTVKNVTYGELKQIVEKEKLSAQLAEFHNTDNIIVTTSQRAKIKTLKINYKIKNSTSYKH